MKQVEEGQKIGAVVCPGCGNDVPVKVNKNKCCYVYCQTIVGQIDDSVPRRRSTDKKITAERCWTRLAWGREASRKMIENFLKEQNDVRPENEKIEDPAESGNEPGVPESVPVNGKPGIGSKLKHFLTAD